MKVAYFPVPYKNEYIYSMISRYCVHTGQSNYLNVHLALFGSDRIKEGISSESVSNLVKNAGIFLGNYSVQKLIEGHTLANVYLPFMRSDNHQRILAESSMEIQFDMPTITNRRSKTHPICIKICLECRAEQLDDIGEEFFIREHQVYGVRYCGKHLVKLQRINSTYDVRHKYRHKRPIYKPTFDYKLHSRRITGNRISDFDVYVLRAISQLLDRPIHKCIENDKWQKFYQFHLVNTLKLIGHSLREDVMGRRLLSLASQISSSHEDYECLYFDQRSIISLFIDTDAEHHPFIHFAAWFILFPARSIDEILKEIIEPIPVQQDTIVLYSRSPADIVVINIDELDDKIYHRFYLTCRWYCGIHNYPEFIDLACDYISNSFLIYDFKIDAVLLRSILPKLKRTWACINKFIPAAKNETHSIRSR